MGVVGCERIKMEILSMPKWYLYIYDFKKHMFTFTNLMSRTNNERELLFVLF